MSSTWHRVVIAGGLALGVAIVGLAVIAYALLSGDDNGHGAEVARITQTATASPTTTMTPRPTPTPRAATPEPTPQATPQQTQEPAPIQPIVQQPVPPSVEEQAPPPQEEPPPPEEPPARTSESSALTVAPPPPTPTALAPTPEPSSTTSGGAPPVVAARCQAWIDAGQPPTDTEGLFACVSVLTELCLAYQSNPSVAGGAEACQALDILVGSYPQPPAGTGGETVVESCIEGDFEGWEGDTVFELCNGQVWVQLSPGLLLHLALRPDVTIVSTGEGYRMFVEGVSDSILVSQVTDFIRTCIDGEFEGWEGDTVFELCNGQVWQQASYDYTYHYAYRPDVLIYRSGAGYRMKVEGVRDTIKVIRLQ